MGREFRGCTGAEGVRSGMQDTDVGTRDVLRAYCTRIRYLICIFSHPASSGLISSSASAPLQLLFVIFSVASKQKECCHVGEWKTTATSFKGAITQEFNCTSISISGSYKYEDGACPVQTNVGVALPAWISRVGVIDSWHSPVQIPRWSYYNCIHY